MLFANTLLDRGGTFTDVVVLHGDGTEQVFKLLSSDPKNYNDAPIEALRRIVGGATGREIPRGVPLNLNCIRKSTNHSRFDRAMSNQERF